MINPLARESTEKFRRLIIHSSYRSALQTTFILFDEAHLTKNKNEITNSEPLFDQ
jgi:hypothetical protein